ncbi:MAG: sensor histidine kinase, partial [Miltoncostaeaceae bacterium]
TEHESGASARPERIGTSGLLWGVARGDEDRLRAAGLRVEIEISEGTPPIWADLRQVQDVLTSLVANAERFTPVGGTITLWAAPGRDDRVLLGVRDTGPGVGPAELRAVFEPFVRGAEAIGRPGDGLGLSGARAVTERLGGSLMIEPGRDGGPRMELPAAPGEARLEAPVASAA